jgi:hypothetical protein
MTRSQVYAEAVFKEKRGVLDPLLEPTIISPYLIVDSEVQLAITTSKGKGVKWGRSILLVEHIFFCTSVNFHNVLFMSIGKGSIRGRGWEQTVGLTQLKKKRSFSSYIMKLLKGSGAKSYMTNCRLTYD